MRRRTFAWIGAPARVAAAGLLWLIVLAAPVSALAALNDCGQPVSDGIAPVASDCLFILGAAVGINTCDYDCICDTGGDALVRASDALGCLKRAVGQDFKLACACEVPQLLGLNPEAPLILPIEVQAAYNDDTMFFQISWEGDRGDVHDYVHFIDGAWRYEGAHRRDGQATIDNDPARGSTSVRSTIYESRVTFMLDDPDGPNSVPNFANVGCFITCHDNSRVMPEWDAVSDFTKYLNDGTPGSLDLWHHRLHRANPIGASDDQFVATVPIGSDTGGRIRDAGTSTWAMNDIGLDGNPAFTFDPATTNGLFAFLFDAVYTDPLRFIRNAATVPLGDEEIGAALGYAEAVAMGYGPQEGDAIPRRVLRTPAGSAGDITGFGTRFVPSDISLLFGRWYSNTQRLLDTGNTDDTALADGGVYNIAFAVHYDKVTVRDHYVGFPMTLSLGGGDADVEAVKVTGSGRETLPDFTDTATFPVKQINLFKPGITSFEFLKNENTGKQYIDPVTDTAVDQLHAGAGGINAGTLGCRDCHTAAATDPFEPVHQGGFFAGSMEALAPLRGGINTPTPIPPSP